MVEPNDRLGRAKLRSMEQRYAHATVSRITAVG